MKGVIAKMTCTACNKLKSNSHFFFTAGTYGTHCKTCRSFDAVIAGWMSQGINITKKEYQFLAEAQSYRCKICSDQYPTWSLKPARRLAVDHDHDTKKVRALLCLNCNTGLGKFKDSQSLLQKAIEYLNANAG
jgi:hypothetical protein